MCSLSSPPAPHALPAAPNTPVARAAGNGGALASTTEGFKDSAALGSEKDDGNGPDGGKGVRRAIGCEGEAEEAVRKKGKEKEKN